MTFGWLDHGALVEDPPIKRKHLPSKIPPQTAVSGTFRASTPQRSPLPFFSLGTRQQTPIPAAEIGSVVGTMVFVPQLHLCFLP